MISVRIRIRLEGLYDLDFEIFFDLIHPGTLACDTALASLRELA